MNSPYLRLLLGGTCAYTPEAGLCGTSRHRAAFAPSGGKGDMPDAGDKRSHRFFGLSGLRGFVVSVLRPTICMRNFDCNIRKLTAPIPQCGLKPDDKIQLVVRLRCQCDEVLITGAAGDIGPVVAGIFEVCFSSSSALHADAH